MHASSAAVLVRERNMGTESCNGGGVGQLGWHFRRDNWLRRGASFPEQWARPAGTGMSSRAANSARAT
jgi:hypothetical protein